MQGDYTSGFGYELVKSLPLLNGDLGTVKMTTLFSHQKTIIDENPVKCGFWLGTGSSKTRIALELAEGKTLVICPKTQKEDQNWERENLKWNCGVNLTVLSKETFKKYVSCGMIDLDYETVIVDEAETCLGATPNISWVKKQPVVKASETFNRLCDFIAKCAPKRLYLVTATITRSPMTVWAAAKLLGKDWNFYEYRQTFYFRLPMPGREVWMAKNDNETKDRLARVVQSLGYVGRLEDYFDVPPQTYKTIYTNLNEAQKKRIKELAIEYPDPIVLLGKRHQVENGSLKGNEFSDTELFDNEKLEKIKDFALEFPRMIVFAKYTAQIEQIADALKDKVPHIYKLTGSTPERGKMLAEAIKDERYVFIAQSQISAGWELPDCPVVIFASMSYSITDRIQAEGRIHRANNLKKNLYITLVARGGIDEAVFRAIENKKDFNERIYLNL